MVRGDTNLGGSSGEAIEFAAIASVDQTCAMHVLNTLHCWQSEERKALIVFLSCCRLSQWHFRCVSSASNYANHRKPPRTKDYWENHCLHKSAAGLKMLHTGRSQLHLLIISCWLNYVKMLGEWVLIIFYLASLERTWWTEDFSCSFIKVGLLFTKETPLRTTSKHGPCEELTAQFFCTKAKR